MRQLPFALFALLAATPALADFRADYESAAGGNAPALSRIELSGQKLRVDAGNVSMLFDGGSGKKIILMHDKRQYMDMDRMAQTAGAAMSQAQAALANLPPEQRAMIEQRMGGHMPGGAGASAQHVVRMLPTGASDRVAGYACQVYRTEIDGRHTQDSCLASSADAGISAADRIAVQRAFEQMKTFSEKLSGGMLKAPIVEMPQDRFPVRISAEDGREARLKGISNAAVDAGDFAIPAGYTEQDLGGRPH